MAGKASALAVRRKNRRRAIVMASSLAPVPKAAVIAGGSISHAWDSPRYHIRIML